MVTGSQKKINARREEIINACEKLYQTMNFKEITLKEIGNETLVTRTSIYNYFQTKEEIFLALLKREYELWAVALEKEIESHTCMTDQQIAGSIAQTLEQRKQLLRLLAMNLYEMEEHSRVEMLADFKKSYRKAKETVTALLVKFRPDLSIQERKDFVCLFFLFMFGIYPYTAVTTKQQQALALAGVGHTARTVRELVERAVLTMLPQVRTFPD